MNLNRIVIFPAFALAILATAACSETKVTTSIEIDRSPEQVWAAFNDVSRMDQWVTGFRSAELIEGERGAVGSKSRLVFEEDGNTFELIETVTALEPRKSLGLSVYHESMTTQLDYAFAPTDQGFTLVTISNRTRGNNLFWSVMLGLMQSTIKERHDEDLAAFKKMVEAE